MKALADKREELDAKERSYSELSQQLHRFEEKKKEMAKSLEETKVSLGNVRHQIVYLKGQHESLFQKRGKKKRLMQQLMASTHQLMQQVIAELQESVAELSEKIEDLEKKINEQEDMERQIKTRLLEQERENDKLRLELEEVRKQKESLKNTLEEDTKQFQREIQRRIFELKLKEVDNKIIEMRL